MMIKKLIKKGGKVFVSFDRREERELCQSVLVVEGSYLLPYGFSLIISGVKKKFSNANFTVLTFTDKKEFLKNNFPDARIVTPDENIKIKRFQFFIQLIRLLLRKEFDFIALSSLDIFPVIISLFFSRCSVFLCNRWQEWYLLRLRTVGDLVRKTKSVDRHCCQRRRGVKERIKALGRMVVVLMGISEEDISQPVLVVDNGYTGIDHVSTAVRRAEKTFINPNITILTFPARKHYFTKMFPQMKIVVVDKPNKRYGLAQRMIGLRKEKFYRVVLTALDVSPIAAGLLFMRRRVLLYNKWHQWWGLRVKTPFGYIKGFFKGLAMIPLCVYLLITASFILIRKSFRLGLKENWG